MSTVGEVLKGLREAILLNDRVERMAKKVDQLDARQSAQLERLVRVEAFIDLVRPAITRRALPPRDDG